MDVLVLIDKLDDLVPAAVAEALVERVKRDPPE